MIQRLKTAWRVLWANEYFCMTPWGTNIRHIPNNKSTISQFCDSFYKKIQDSQ